MKITPVEETCPYCSAHVAHGPDSLRCRACGARHHRDCWNENGGCAVVGCDEGHALPPPLPPTKVKSASESPSQSAAAPPPIPGRPGQSVLPWVALFVAGIAVVVVVTLLILGGSDGEDSTPPPDDPPIDREANRDPNPDPGPPSAPEIRILEGEDYSACGGGAFGSNASEGFCRKVARQARSKPEAGLLPPVTSSETGWSYTMSCSPYAGQANLPGYRVCTEIETSDPARIEAGGIAAVVVGP